MLRKFLCAVVALGISLGVILADELKGTIEKVDNKKGVISVKVEGKKKAMNVRAGKDTKVTDAEGKEIAEGLKSASFAPGKEVTITYEKEGKKMLIKEIKVGK